MQAGLGRRLADASPESMSIRPPKFLKNHAGGSTGQRNGSLEHITPRLFGVLF